MSEERSSDILREAIYYRIFLDAENARWRMADIPWNAIERDRVTPELLAIVREAAFFELTTYTATQRFLDAFRDDVDLTQWMSVWFYEETKHPQALLRWLREFGVAVDRSFLLRGRRTEPFMESLVGTLVTNIISEMVASSRYANLRKLTKEPVLRQIAEHLAADEARHASGFYSYAERYIAEADDPEAERLVALKVLYLWTASLGAVQHPVNQFITRVTQDVELADELPFDFADVRTRACRVIGILTGTDISGPRELMPKIRKLHALHARG